MNKLDEHLQKIQEVVPMSVYIGLSAASLIVSATKMYKDYFTKIARRCSDLPPKEKSLCMLRSKMLAKNVQLQTLKGSIAKCAKAKDQMKCKEKVSGKMQKLAGEVKYLADRFKDVKASANK